MKLLKLSAICAIASINCACADRVYWNHPHRAEVIVGGPDVILRDRVVIDPYVGPVFEEPLSGYPIHKRIRMLRQQIEKLRIERDLHPEYAIEINKHIHNCQVRIRELEGY